jgi:arabinofuranan 3-O-arabinosyltransferase
LSIALKPVLIPLALLLVFHRHWRALAVLVVVPLCLNLAAVAVSVAPQHFLFTTLPLLLGGNTAHGENVSIAGAASRLGAPSALGIALRVIVAAGAVGIFARIGREQEDVPVAMALLALTFLVASFAWMHYAIFLLPLLPWAVARRGYHNWIALVALYCLCAPDLALWLKLGAPGFDYLHLRVTAGLGLAVVLVWRVARLPREAGRPAPVQLADSPHLAG